MKKPTIDRYLNRIKIVDGHHIWQGATVKPQSNYKYGVMITDNHMKVCVHRWAKQYFSDESIEGRHVRKLCGVELCVNPDHHKVV